MLYPAPIAKLIDSYSKLPGIGIKTATRLAFYTIGMSDDDVNEFAKNLLNAKRELGYCSICGNLNLMKKPARFVEMKREIHPSFLL